MIRILYLAGMTKLLRIPFPVTGWARHRHSIYDPHAIRPAWAVQSSSGHGNAGIFAFLRSPMAGRANRVGRVRIAPRGPRRVLGQARPKPQRKVERDGRIATRVARRPARPPAFRNLRHTGALRRPA